MAAAMFCRTVMLGNRAYCWNRYPTLRRWGGRSMCPALSYSTVPSSSIWPSSGRMIPATHRSVTLLPQPEAPSRARGAPASAVKAAWS